MKQFNDGFKEFQKNASGFGAFQGKSYVASVEDAIQSLSENINDFSGFKTDSNILKGDVAEFWHSGTFNIDSALKGNHSKTFVDRSHDFASADIKSNFGKDYGLKYYKNASSSANAQSTSLFERYKSGNTENQSFSDFLKERGISESDVLKHDPIYSGQVRIIPKDQLEEAVIFLKRKIAEESVKRPELVHKYEETLKNLTDKIESSDGSKSISLTEADARKIAEIAKEGEFDPSDYGLTTEELINFNYVMEQALKAGLSAAAISATLKIAPEIFKLIQKFFNDENIDIDSIKNLGLAGLQGGAEGFIKGGISAGLTTAFSSGLLGESLKNIDPTFIGSATVIAYNTVLNSYKLASNKINKQEFIDLCMRDLFITTIATSLGGVSQGIIQLPVLGYLIGSFIGSVVATFIYDNCDKIFLSFCTKTGCTFFGIVKQDYKIDEEILKSIGIDVFNYEQLIQETFNVEKFELNTFKVNNFEKESIDITFIRRGVIGVRKIAYIAS